jgi:2-polyprenyl-3-methyl-5-hydroxy-6-metoxy-1,4-benzoquinol methylase
MIPNWNEAYRNGRKFAPVSEIVLDKIIDKTSGSVLDIGCGKGELTRQMQSRGFEVAGIDLSDVAIREAVENNPDGLYVIGDFMDLELDAKYDYIFVNLVLAFAEDRKAFLDKARSMLKSDGKLVVISPVLLLRYLTKYSPHLKDISIPWSELKQLMPDAIEADSGYFEDYGTLKVLVEQ